VLTFDEGPDGYKGRCPKCGAVVRLRVEKQPVAPAVGKSAGGRPPRPSDPRLSVVALRSPGPAEPGGPDPDATTPFAPIDEVVLEEWTPPPAKQPAPSLLRQYRLALVVGGLTLSAVGAAAVVIFWLWLSR
jgi:hypothetical protein